MKIRLILIVVLSLVLVSAFPKVECKSVFDYRATIRVGNLYCLFDYPLEAHVGDTYTYELNVSADATIHISSFEMYVMYWSANGENGQSYNIASGRIMSGGDSFLRDIEFTVPSSINYPRVHVNFWITIESSSWVALIYETNVVDKTSSELRSEIYSLQTNYTNLMNDYVRYNNSHIYSNSDYNALNSAYEQYKQDHSYSNNDYNNAQYRYDALNGELSVAKTLNYALIALFIISLASTIYFAAKRAKIKLPPPPTIRGLRDTDKEMLVK